MMRMRTAFFFMFVGWYNYLLLVIFLAAGEGKDWADLQVLAVMMSPGLVLLALKGVSEVYRAMRWRDYVRRGQAPNWLATTASPAEKKQFLVKTLPKSPGIVYCCPYDPKADHIEQRVEQVDRGAWGAALIHNIMARVASYEQPGVFFGQGTARSVVVKRRTVPRPGAEPEYKLSPGARRVFVIERLLPNHGRATFAFDLRTEGKLVRLHWFFTTYAPWGRLDVIRDILLEIGAAVVYPLAFLSGERPDEGETFFLLVPIFNLLVPLYSLAEDLVYGPLRRYPSTTDWYWGYSNTTELKERSATDDYDGFHVLVKGTLDEVWKKRKPM
jgi:hypothetical protein